MAHVDQQRVDAALDAVMLAASSNLPPIVWPNTQTDVSALSLFVRISRVSYDTTWRTLSGLQKRGVYRIVVWGDVGQGETIMAATASQIASLFTIDQKLDDYVRVSMIDTMSVTAEDDCYYSATVEIDWSVDYQAA